jgi:hypothetical protein
MAGTTPKYGFPYPTGTDRVADGDNAIQALALKIEQTVGATNGWSMQRGSTDGFAGDSTWKALHSLPCTGCGVARLVLVLAFTNLSNFTSGVYVQTQITSPDVSAVGPGSMISKDQSAGAFWFSQAVGYLCITNAANPVFTVMGLSNGGAPSVEAQSSIIAFRIQ